MSKNFWLKKVYCLPAARINGAKVHTLSNETLKDAQEHPENYKDLLVRVAGYSAQWTNLSREMQDSIMARCAHEAY